MDSFSPRARRGVLNERYDTLVSPQRTRLYHYVGMFFLADGKIVEWTDDIISQS